MSTSESMSQCQVCNVLAAPERRGSILELQDNTCGKRVAVAPVANALNFQPYIGVTISPFSPGMVSLTVLVFDVYTNDTVPTVTYSSDCDRFMPFSGIVSGPGPCNSTRYVVDISSKPWYAPISILFFNSTFASIKLWPLQTCLIETVYCNCSTCPSHYV